MFEKAKLIDAGEVAYRLNVTVRAVQRYASDKQLGPLLGARRIGSGRGVWRFDPDRVATYLQRTNRRIW